MDSHTAAAINEHLGLAFNHLQEAIMLALAGEPTGEAGGALGRLERFVESGGDTDVLLEGLDDMSLRPRPGETPEQVVARVVEAAGKDTGLFDNDDFSKKVETEPREYEDTPFTPEELAQAKADVEAVINEPVEEPTLHKPEDAPGVESGEHPGLEELDVEEDEEDEFSGLFDDIDEDVEDDDPSDAPAAF